MPVNLAQHWQRHDAVAVDTTDILFVCAGTFTDVFAYGARGALARVRRARRRPPREPARPAEGPARVRRCSAEFLGRSPSSCSSTSSVPDELLEVLTGPPDAVVRE